MSTPEPTHGKPQAFTPAVILPSDDPHVALLKVPVVQIPVDEIETYSAATTPPSGFVTEPISFANLNVNDLPADPAYLKALIQQLLEVLAQERADKAALRATLERLALRLYGPRTERVDKNQLLLFSETDNPADTPATELPPEPPRRTRRKARPHGRRTLPENLKREVIDYELTEEERLCNCGTTRIDIGVDESEQLNFRPASLFVQVRRTHKYACPCCQKAQTQTNNISLSPIPVGPIVVSATKPADPIPKGLAGPGLLAEVIVNKFIEHFPLYRQVQRFARHGFHLERSTLCSWLADCGRVLTPLYEMLKEEVLKSAWLHTDDTSIKIQSKTPGPLQLGRFWAYLGDREHPYNVFDFTKTRKREGPQTFLQHYKGYLQADAFSGYDGLYLPTTPGQPPEIIEVACHAHARRKFYEALSSDSFRAAQALAWYRQLYEIETQGRGKSDEYRLCIRQELSVPILAKFKAWLQLTETTVTPKSPLGQAVQYALNQWAALECYTTQGFLEIDNNVAEREMKKIAIGRKNWLFVGSPAGGQTAAILLSFTATCQRLKIEPWTYLEDVLRRLPTVPQHEYNQFLPLVWQAARAKA